MGRQAGRDHQRGGDPDPFAHHRVRREPLPRQRMLLHRLGKLVRDMAEHRGHQLVPAADVPPDQRQIDVGRRCDVTKRHRVNPMHGKQRRRGIEHRPAYLVRPRRRPGWPPGPRPAGSVRVAHRLNHPRTPQRSRSADTPASNPRSPRRASASLCAVTGGSAPPSGSEGCGSACAESVITLGWLMCGRASDATISAWLSFAWMGLAVWM